MAEYPHPSMLATPPPWTPDPSAAASPGWPGAGTPFAPSPPAAPWQPPPAVAPAAVDVHPLKLNRLGRLHPSQRRSWIPGAAALAVAVVPVVVALLSGSRITFYIALAVAAGLNGYGLYQLGCVVIEQRCLSKTGTARLWTVTQGNPSSPQMTFHINVAGRSLRLTPQQYDSIPAGETVRIYYTWIGRVVGAEIPTQGGGYSLW